MLAQRLQQLRTARGDDFIFAQGAVNALEALLEYQQKPEIQINNQQG